MKETKRVIDKALEDKIEKKEKWFALRKAIVERVK